MGHQSFSGEGGVMVKRGKKQVIVIAERCKECGFCIDFCPKHILGKSDEINSRGYYPVCVDDNDECTGCNICSMICPDFAIYITSVEGKHFSI